VYIRVINGIFTAHQHSLLCRACSCRRDVCLSGTRWYCSVQFSMDIYLRSFL